MNGSAAIHDFELAAFGGTSEDVAAGLGDGTFGMAEETGRDMNAALASGAKAQQGAGEALAGHLRARRDLPGREVSVLLACAELGVPVVATNDAHYLRKDDAEAHDVLLAIGTGKDLDDPNRFRFFGRESYVKSEQEMCALFPDRPDVIAETARLAALCEFDFEKRYYLPQYPRPAEFASDTDLLVHLARDGARRRYGDPVPPEVEQRLQYELDVIARTGYAGYFLIVYDFIKAAKDRGIPVGPGRGSAAGSLVAYALGITSIDPLKFDLLFERFLNPERVTMPDIDPHVAPRGG